MKRSPSLPESLPLVSICIPAYNAARFIAATLESALAQDYPLTEVIVSDDGSTDGTPEMVARYTGRGVRLVRQPRNLGRYANANVAIRTSRGTYICKLDADDLLEPHYVSSLLAVMARRPRLAFAHCACRLIDVDGNFLGYERSIRGSFIRAGLAEWPRYVLGPRAVNIVMLRRQAFDAVGGYDERFRYSGDWKMHRDLLAIGDVFYADNLLASYRVHRVGKAGVRLLQAYEHLLHLADMERHWPVHMRGKTRLLTRARRLQALGVAKAAAWSPPDEARELLAVLPLYGDFLGPRLLARLASSNAGGLVRYYLDKKLRLRQQVKALFYQKTSPESLAPALEIPSHCPRIS